MLITAHLAEPRRAPLDVEADEAPRLVLAAAAADDRRRLRQLLDGQRREPGLCVERGHPAVDL
jgi:hypothetical protein